MYCKIRKILEENFGELSQEEEMLRNIRMILVESLSADQVQDSWSSEQAQWKREREEARIATKNKDLRQQISRL